MGPIIGAIVLLICLGFVVMMMISEWSRPESMQANPAASGSARSIAAAPKKKAAPKAKKAASKKKAAKKTKK